MTLKVAGPPSRKSKRTLRFIKRNLLFGEGDDGMVLKSMRQLGLLGHFLRD
jgi:hypothetical protein